ncbi:hypothetical protein LBMAG44_13430 [Gemmatimonadota bacterium]|nr:hypothetical protein LBMAG44_13430 [Gemmatimonadota bacterium]
MTISKNRMGRATALTLSAVLLAFTPGCEQLRGNLLDAVDPDLIMPATITSPEAADALRVGTLSRVRGITAGGEGVWMLGGLLVDEWKSSDTFSQRNETDQRSIQESNGNVQGMWKALPRVRTSAREAINALKQYKPAPAWGIGQMYFSMGLAELMLAENFCNGTPLGDGSTGEPIYGPALSNAQVLALAVAHFDSAAQNALPATDASAIVLANLVKVHKARALIDLGQFAAAAALVSGIPTSYVEPLMTYSLTTGDNQVWSLNTSAKRWTVGDSVDGAGRIANAIPFASLGDTRVRTVGSTLGTSAAGRGFDGTTNLVTMSWYARSDAAYLASGVDARLIEAEARLQAQDIAGVTTILNALRAATQKLSPSYTTAVLPALAAPATQAEAVTLFFREKALWQFSRGFRLNDLRRMVRQYGRTQDQVFPTGIFFKSGTPYLSDVNFPVTTDEYNNPNFKGCTDRKA